MGETAKITLVIDAEGTHVLDDTGKHITTLKRDVEDLGAKGAKGFSAFQAAVVTANQALELGVRIARGVATVYSEVTGEAIAQQNATKALEQTLRSTGQYSRAYLNELDAISAGYQRTTRYSDDAVLGVERTLVSFNAGRGQINQLTGAVLDLSAGLGIELRGATLLVGKAVAGEFGTLGRYGIIVDENATKSEKLAQALDQISTRFGGQAASAASTYGGRMDQLGNALGEVKEQLGFIAVGSNEATSGLGRTANEVQRVAEAIGEWRQQNQTLIDLHIENAFATAADAVSTLDTRLSNLRSSGAVEFFERLWAAATTGVPVLDGDAAGRYRTGSAVDPNGVGRRLGARSSGVDLAETADLINAGRAQRLDRGVFQSVEMVEVAPGYYVPRENVTLLGDRVDTSSSEATARELADARNYRPRSTPRDFDAEKKAGEEAKKLEKDRLAILEEQSAIEGKLIAQRREADETLAAVGITRAQTQVELAKQRLAFEDTGNLTTERRLELAGQIDVAEQRATEAKIAALTAQEEALLAAGPPTVDQLAKTEAIAAEVERINALWAVTPTAVQKANAELEKSGKINLGDSIRDVIAGTGLGTGDLGDSLERLGESVGSKLFAGVLKKKADFDLTISENFLEDIPGWFETGASYASDAWSSTLDAMGLASESTSSRISDSFSRAFDEISGRANDTAQVVGGTLRNVPGVGNVAELFNGGANVTLSRGSDGRFTAVNEFDQRFTGANAGQVANVAGGGGASGATLGATVGAAAASFGIALGVQAGLEGIGEVRRLSKSDNPADLEYARHAMLDPVQAGLAKMLGVHDLTLLRGFNAMFSMGISEVAQQMFKAMGVFAPPHAEGVAGNQIGDILTELGIPIARASGGRRPGGPSTRVYDPNELGDLGYPQVPIPDAVRADLRGGGLIAALAQFSQLRFGGLNGVGLQGEFDATSGPLRAVLNNAAALGLGVEDTRRQVGRVTRGLSGETFDEGVLTLRKESQDRLFGIRSRNDGRVSAHVLEQEQEALERGIAGLIEAYDEDLPRAVGSSNVALLAFGENGELQMAALNRQLETAKDLAAGLDFSGAARAGFSTTSEVSLSGQLTRNARRSAADALLGGLAEGGIGDPFKEFTASIAEGTEALRNGNFDEANDIIERAGREFDVARQSADEFFDTAREKAPALARLIDRIEIEGLADGFKDAAKDLRDEADDIGLGLLKPKQREAELRSRLGANQAEIDAILNSSGGADTAEELRRLGELGTARRELLGDLGQVLDERYVDGSRREVAAMQEVQGGLNDLAGILEAAGLSAKTQADSLAEQTESTSANTAATDANTAELANLADAIRSLAASADNAGGALDAGAIAFIVRAVSTSPQLKAALRDVVA